MLRKIRPTAEANVMKQREEYSEDYDTYLAEELRVLRHLGGVSVDSVLALMDAMEEA